MAKKKEEQKDTSLKWCYFGKNKEYVMMTCTKEDWESIRNIIEWARNRLHQDRGDYVPRVSESDEWNYGYTTIDYLHGGKK